MVRMRKLALASIVALLTTASSAALARGKSKRNAAANTDSRLTYLDDEPMSRQATRVTEPETGTYRTIEMQTAGPADVQNGAQTDERGATRDPMAGRTARPMSGALEELAHRQMRRHQKS